MTNEVRSRSYRMGTMLSGGETTAHFYMKLGEEDDMPMAMIEGNLEQEPKKQRKTAKKKKAQLAIVGRLQRLDGDGDENSVKPLFATEVDESMLQASRLRLQSRFGLVTWQPKRLITEQMHDIINPKVISYFKQADDALTMNRPEVCLRLLVRINHLDHARESAVLESQMRFFALTELCDLTSSRVVANRHLYSVERLAWCYFMYGQSQLDIGLFTQALKAFTEASILEPRRVEHRLKQIEALYRLQRYVECIGIITDLLREYKKDKAKVSDLFILRARFQDKLSNVKEVLNDIERALRVDSNHEGARQFLMAFRKKADDMRDEAMVMYAKGRFREAVDRLSTCLQTNPDNPDYYFKRGLVQRRLGDYRKAVDDLLEAMAKMELAEQLNTLSLNIMEDARRQLMLLMNDMAIDCYKRGMLEDSIRLLERAIRFDNKEAAFYVNRGDCFYALDDFASALNDYEQALELAPGHEGIATRVVLIHSHRGLVAMRERNFVDAELALSAAIKIRPHDFDLRILLCRSHLMLGKEQDAGYDIVAALVLNAPLADPHVATLLPRLFPGQSVEEVLASEFGRLVMSEIGVKNAEAEKLRSRSPMRSPSLHPSQHKQRIGTLTFSAEIAELLNAKLLVYEEMRVLTSDTSREDWLKLATKLAARTTKWRGPSEGPLERPLNKPSVARLHPDGNIRLVSKKKSYAFRWKTADMHSFREKFRPQSIKTASSSATFDVK